MPTLEETPCPGCGQTKLRIENRLEAMPIGSFSLAGLQMKVSAREWPYLVCGGCGISAKAKA